MQLPVSPSAKSICAASIYLYRDISAFQPHYSKSTTSLESVSNGSDDGEQQEGDPEAVCDGVPIGGGHGGGDRGCAADGCAGWVRGGGGEESVHLL